MRVTGLLRCLLIALMALFSIQCSKEKEKKEKKTAASDSIQPQPTPSPRPPTPLESIMAAETLEQAVGVAKPLMKDTFDNTSQGALLLGLWASQRLTWADLEKVPETEYDLVMKDSDEERGKRLCGRGNLVEIHVEKTKWGKLYNGGMFFGSWYKRRVIRFIAVKSSGKLVQGKRARFCGIITGRYSYSNSKGGTTHAVSLVGMFDLPENKPAAR